MKRTVLDTNIIISSALGGALVLILEGNFAPSQFSQGASSWIGCKNQRIENRERGLQNYGRRRSPPFSAEGMARMTAR